MVWTCDIRSGVKWSDGVPLTSKDIAFTYRFILDNGLSSFSDYLPFNPTFETPNDTTLIWKSEKPTFAPTVPPWVPILPEHIWSKYDGQGAKAIKAVDPLADGPMVGSGPFVLTEWKPGEFFTMDANKDYWGGSPTIDEIVYQIFDNREAMVQALKGGQIDFADDLNPTLFNALQGEDDIATNAAAPPTFTNFAWNFGSTDMPNDTHNPALEDLVVRQAVSYGTNLQAHRRLACSRAMPCRGPRSRFPSRPGTSSHPPTSCTPSTREGQADPRRRRLRRHRQRRHPRGSRRRTAARVQRPDDQQLSGSNDIGKLMQGWMKDIGIQLNLQPVSESKALRGVGRRRLRRLHLGLGR